jgi:hypothetical protein
VATATKTKVLLILSSDVLDRARVLAGRMTTTFKLPVSLQIVLRALIEEGLKRERDPALLDNVERQAQAVRDARSVAHQGRASRVARTFGPRPPHGRARSRPGR